ncbi:hypothetical protein [Thermoflavimicrobium dichotomicum]|uniref:Uncharacterized protein n=1 Tax=Thermoflavimicrobium dichotomicum TaxID=46223 RepID=A0A1I3MUS0_9BACL|nr:hypothetical protein [Thermoflavimicrobium dichotomicum]SFJ00692.1 hypothetical protein SAMN05421852_103209 [Thermoflavimicrobium dichotomicum]
MEAIKEGLSAFILGFFRLFIVSLAIWMAGLLFLLFRELFSARVFQFQEYLRKLWKLFLFAFEGVAYGAVVITPLLIYLAEKKLNYIMVWVAAIILSVIYIYIRRQTGTLFSWKDEIRKLSEKMGDRRKQDPYR